VYGVRYPEGRDEFASARVTADKELEEIGVEALEAREIRVSFGTTVCWGV